MNSEIMTAALVSVEKSALKKDDALQDISWLLIRRMNTLGWVDFRTQLLHHIANDEDDGRAWIAAAIEREKMK